MAVKIQPMFLSKHYKLQARNSDKALVMTIPANIVRNFNLTKASKLRMTYQNDKLVIDLPPLAREAAA
jgi:hypothetical protein